MIPSDVPRPYQISETFRKDDSLTQAILEQCYLPCSPITSSLEENAKFSVLVESLVRLFLTRADLCLTPTLDEAVEIGINEREKKAKSDRKRGQEAEMSRLFLKMSGQRLRSLLLWAEQSTLDD